MEYFVLSIIVIALFSALLLAVQDEAGLAHQAVQTAVFQSRSKNFNNFDVLQSELESKLPLFTTLLGSGSLFKFVIPSIAITSLATLFIGPMLTNPVFGFILGLVMSLAYCSRLFFYFAQKFRAKLLGQLERILLAIRNNLSTGMVLDYAVNNALQYNQEAPLGPHLAKFIKVSEANFLENFPLWLKSIKNSFNLKELAQASQLLALELTYTTNQEEAFVNAAADVANRLSANSKQRNSIFVTFLTMDFMVIAFFVVLFWVIPGFSFSPDEDWWLSARRPLMVFIAGLVVWGAYAITVIVTIWRQS